MYLSVIMCSSYSWTTSQGTGVMGRDFWFATSDLHLSNVGFMIDLQRALGQSALSWEDNQHLCGHTSF